MNSLQRRLRALERRKTLQARSGGFSLMEVMVVMGLIAILATFSVTSVSSTYQANRIDGNMATLSGLMERAHEAAIAGNSYVWVAFTDNPPAASPATGVAAVVFAAQDGSDALNNFSVGTSASPVAIDAVTGFHVLNSVQSFPGIDLTNAGAITTITGLPTVTPSPASLQGGMSLTMSRAGQSYIFTRVIEYLPDGESKVSTWNNWVEFGVQSATTGASLNKAVARLSKLTGKLTIYRQ